MLSRFFLSVLVGILLCCCAPNDKSTDGTERGNNLETTASNTDNTLPPVSGKQKRIIFFGNSLTAAYGLDPQLGFVALIQKKLDSLGYDYQTVNAGLSGETTAGGRERIDWILNQPVDIFILELGGNDGLRGIDPNSSKENLQAIIDAVQQKYPQAKIILAGMEAPPNMGSDFTSAFRKMYPSLAKKNDVALIPFLLDGVGGEPSLNLPDGIHPNEEGHVIVANNIWKVLKNLLPEEVG